MNYAAILFDMDGTLLETGPLWERATREILAQEGLDYPDKFPGLGEHLALKGYNEEAIARLRASRVEALLPMIKEDARWRPHARETVSAIAVPTAIVTSSHRNVVDALDEVIGVRGPFKVIVVAEDVEPHLKPHPKGLLMVCASLGVDPTKCLYVGDQRVDLEAATAAGMDFVLARGTHTPKSFTHEKMINEIDELSEYLK